MAKKSKNTKKPRFGNPAKAAASKAAGTEASNVLSLSDAIAQRAKAGLLPETMDRLAADFRSWMTAAGVPGDEVDRLSSLLMNYFRNYAASVSIPDPTNLDVELTGLMLEDAGRFHPEMRISVSLALNSYLKFMVTTGAWTGPTDAMLELLDLTATDILAPPRHELAPYVFHDSANPVADGVDRASRPYVQRAVALLTWIGGGRPLTATGLLRRKDIAEAAACVDAHVVGSARVDYAGPGNGSPRAVTSMANVPRLMDYWHALIDTGLLTAGKTKAAPTKAAEAFLKAPELAQEKTMQLAYCLFYDCAIPFDDAAPSVSAEAGVARLLAAAASNRPDIAIPFDPEEPEPHADTEGPTPPFRLSSWRTLRVNSSISELVGAGLVEQGPFPVVPPSLRGALAPVLEHFDEMIQAAEPER